MDNSTWLEETEVDDLALYDLTRNELRRLTGDHFPADFDLEEAITAYAYFACIVVKNRGKDWETTVQDYAELAVRNARSDSEAEKIELDLLRTDLARTTGRLLDVGAGWGRFGDLYAACGLQAFFVEPFDLGCRLMRRNGLTRSACCPGQQLCFPADSFQGVVIGWVLHHDAPDVPATGLLGEIGRVIAPGGWLYSVEPLSDDFDEEKWRELVTAAGFVVEKMEIFFDMPLPENRHERYGYLTAAKPVE
ncbi:MAG: methyltransferase domain-containing protein [Anaerolineales bacterium]|nr:methyltransferase domain-containing protein [Anaerolineales bacterium]